MFCIVSITLFRIFHDKLILCTSIAFIVEIKTADNIDIS